MKMLIIFLCLVVISILSSVKADSLLKEKTIVIDSGHGGKDPGTVYKDTYEKDINLQIAQYLKKELQKRGIRVVMTRNGDYDLSKPKAQRRKKSDFDNRIKIINSAHANMYISIHLNYLSQTSYYGPQVFYNNLKKENKKIAEVMQKQLNKKLKTNRKIKVIPQTTYMYDKLNIPGVLIECGFLSNSSEREKLKTSNYQQKIAKYIAKGIIKVL